MDSDVVALAALSKAVETHGKSSADEVVRAARKYYNFVRGEEAREFIQAVFDDEKNDTPAKLLDALLAGLT